MSMGTIGKMMKATRTTMVSAEVDKQSAMFFDKFGLRDGDYVEFDRHKPRGGKVRTIGRIILVEDCYYNSRGGYTASIKVAPLLMSGELGNSRSVIVSVSPNGKSFTCLMPGGHFGKLDVG